MAIRKFLLRHAFLPRPSFLRVQWFTEPDPQTGRSNFLNYTAHPWYIKPSFSARWGWKAWMVWFVGGVVPGDRKYFPEGYRICELGPDDLVGMGEVEMDKTRDELKVKRAGCGLGRP